MIPGPGAATTYRRHFGVVYNPGEEVHGSECLAVGSNGSLQAANPAGNKIPGMEIMGSTVLPTVVPPENRTGNIAFRIVKDLPYAFILGASFFKPNSSTI